MAFGAWCSTFGQSSSSGVSLFIHGVTNSAPYSPVMVVELKGAGTKNCLVECSSNLIAWEPLVRFFTRYATPSRYPTNHLVWDPLIESAPNRFYRVATPGQLEPDPLLLWTARKPARYRFHYEACGSLLVNTMTNLTGDVHVENGVIRSLENVTGAEGVPPQLLTKLFRTLDGLFTVVEKGYRYGRTLTVGFDREWGYPRWIMVDMTTEFNAEPSSVTTHRVTQFAVE